MSLCVNYWVYELDFCIVETIRVPAVQCNLRAIKTVGRSHISPLCLIKAAHMHNLRKGNRGCVMVTKSLQLSLQDLTNYPYSGYLLK